MSLHREIAVLPSRLGEPVIAAAFGSLVVLGLAIFELVGRRRLEKQFHRAVDLLVSIVVAAVLVAISIGLGVL